MTIHKDLAITSIESAKAELEQALQELKRMPADDASSIRYGAHALKNYITITRIAVDLLLINLKDHPNSQVGVLLEAVLHASKLMEQSVHMLTDNSLAAEVRLKREPVNLPLLIGRGCEYFRRIAGEKQMQMNFEASVSHPLVLSDRVAVSVVLENLLSNAVKYSPPGAEINVSVREEAGSLVCTVQDSGQGLSSAQIPKLFQRGADVGSVPTGGEPTTGYGLAVAKDLVDKLGGSLWCESEVGKGSRFFFSLPAHGEEDAATSGPENREGDA